MTAKAAGAAIAMQRSGHHVKNFLIYFIHAKP